MTKINIKNKKKLFLPSSFFKFEKNLNLQQVMVKDIRVIQVEGKSNSVISASKFHCATSLRDPQWRYNIEHRVTPSLTVIVHQ